VFEEKAERVRRVQFRLGERGREAARFELAIRLFGRADARGRGAGQQRDARGAMARDRRACGIEEAVRAEAEPGEAVVAAVVRRECPRQRQVLEAVDATDRAGERGAREVVVAQPAAAAAQRLDVCAATAAERGCRGVRGDGERRDAAGHAATEWMNGRKL
jgi:hypothetical protein